jgi:integrase
VNKIVKIKQRTYWADSLKESTVILMHNNDKTPKNDTDIDLLSSILPKPLRKNMSNILTPDDIATLRHLAEQGIGKNSLRALASDFAYLEAWTKAATGVRLEWPAPEALILKFIAHHLWDPAERAINPQHGMPESVLKYLVGLDLLRTNGLHSPATVRRRLFSWSTLTKWRGLNGVFTSPTVKSALALAVRTHLAIPSPKSQKAITRDILAVVLASIGHEKLVDIRDRTLLSTAFASGGRRRSEIAALRVEHIVQENPVRKDPEDENSPLLTCLKIKLGRTKTKNSEHNPYAYLVGKPADQLLYWIKRARLEMGTVFRAIDQWGNLSTRPLNSQSVNLIVKSRLGNAGFSEAEFSAHGLRSGYLTEAANQGIPLPEAMAQSGHTSVQQASQYYNDANRKSGKATRIDLE